MFVKIFKMLLIAILVLVVCTFLLMYTLFAIGNITGITGVIFALVPWIILTFVVIYFLKK